MEINTKMMVNEGSNLPQKVIKATVNKESNTKEKAG